LSSSISLELEKLETNRGVSLLGSMVYSKVDFLEYA